jgi:hypothetical protein
MSNRELISEEELEAVNRYVSYGFSTMNRTLRNYLGSEAPINKMLPLDKNIIAFRYIREYKFLPLDIGDIFESNGYLSTTISGKWMTKAVCESNQGVVMRIHFSKGTKCIYVPGHEYELLFAHGVKLQLMGIYKNSFYCLSNNQLTTNNNIVVYEFVISCFLFETRNRKMYSIASMQIKLICEKIKEILIKEDNVINIYPPISVVGYIHGQFYGLLEFPTI